MPTTTLATEVAPNETTVTTKLTVSPTTIPTPGAQTTSESSMDCVHNGTDYNRAAVS